MSTSDGIGAKKRPQGMRSLQRGRSSMNDGQKRYFDGLAELRQAPWERFNNRRVFEWKMCYTIWLFIVVCTGFMLSGKTSLGPAQTLHVHIAAITIATIHLLWQVRIAIANNKDLHAMYQFERDMANQLGTSWYVEFEAKARSLRLRGLWSHITYLLITVVLLLLALMFTGYGFWDPVDTGLVVVLLLGVCLGGTLGPEQASFEGLAGAGF